MTVVAAVVFVPLSPVRLREFGICSGIVLFDPVMLNFFVYILRYLSQGAERVKKLTTPKPTLNGTAVVARRFESTHGGMRSRRGGREAGEAEEREREREKKKRYRPK